MNLKRYTNRTLYDVDRKCRVSLGHVVRAIRSGETLRVTAEPSGTDCTALLVLKILTLDAQAGARIPAGPLLELVRVERSARAVPALDKLERALLDPGERS